MGKTGLCRSGKTSIWYYKIINKQRLTDGSPAIGILSVTLIIKQVI